MTAVYLRDILEPKKNNLTLLRLIAALAVVVSHAAFLRTGNRADEIFSTTGAYNLGGHAVNVFFVISGLTVAASLERSQSAVEFLSARLIRILPGLIVCSAMLVAMGIIVTNCTPIEYLTDARVWKYFFKTVSLSTGSAELPGVFSSNPYPAVVNASLWTLKFELSCYVLLALSGALNLFKRTFLTWFLPVAFLLASGFLFYRFGGHGDQVEQFARFWLCFSLGVGFYLFRDRIKISWSLGFFLAALMLVALGTAWDRVISPVAVGYNAIVLSNIPLPGLRSFTNKVDLSYGVYIFSWPISQTLLHTMPAISTSSLIFASCGLAISAAVLSWNFVEKPALSRRHWMMSFLRDLVIASRTRPSRNAVA